MKVALEVRMNKVIFWDFDGTLAKAPFLWSGSLHEVILELMPDYNITLEEVRRYTKSGFTWDTPERDYSRLIGDVWWEHMLTYFQDIYQRLGISEEYREKASRMAMEKIKDVGRYQLFDDAVLALKLAGEKGYQNYIVSNHIPELGTIIQKLGIADYFQGYIISSLVGYDKPRREIFECAKKLAGYPKHCYMVGDNPIADIAGGKAAGMKTILVHKDVDCTADAVCTDLLQVMDIIE